MGVYLLVEGRGFQVEGEGSRSRVEGKNFSRLTTERSLYFLLFEIICFVDLPTSCARNFFLNDGKTTN